jgi:hypothetical protein
VANHRGFHAGSVLCVAVVLASLATGCEDKQRCDDSVATTKKAIDVKDFKAARQWRDFTWKACSDKAVIATFDKAILDGEAAERTAAADAVKSVKKEAQQRINRAQRAWYAFDGLEKSARTQEALDKTLSSTKRFGSGLPPEYAQKLADFNQAEYEKRRATLGK